MLTIAGVLTPDDLTLLRAKLAAAAFEDGRRTAKGPARAVKANEQAVLGDAAPALSAFVTKALERNDVFAAYARPARFSGVLFNRYRTGETYGRHVDNAMMGALRTDLSFTLFLSEPDACEGGELVVEGLDGERAVKLAAGSVVLYPTGALHRVEPVTSGERLAAVGWVQSQIRRADEREILFDLAQARTGMADGEARLLLDKSIGNLIRLWGEP